MIPIVISVSILPESGDDMAENYFDFSIYDVGSSPIRTDQIGYSRTDKVKKLAHGTNIDDTQVRSLHLVDDSTSYQNTTGKDAYAMVSVRAEQTVSSHSYKLWVGTTENSKTGASEVFDSNDAIDAVWVNSGTYVTSRMVIVPNNNYLNIENTSGATGRNLKVLGDNGTFRAFVIEQA